MAGILAVGTSIVDIARQAAQLVVTLFEELVAIFGSLNEGGVWEFSIFGYLLLFTACVGIVIFVVRWIASLMKFDRG